MALIIPAAVSLFGAPLGTQPVVNAAAASSGSLIPGLTMSSSSVQAAVPSAGVEGVAGVSAPPAPFADLLTEAVGQVEHYETQAKSAIDGLMTGKGVDVHEAMIATEKSEMGFELVLSVRNKALAAYQQVMGLQF